MQQRLKRTGRWLSYWAKAIVVWIWRFIGRVGLAIRRLLTLFIWRPFLLLTTPFRRLGRLVAPLFRPVWRLWGRMGLALRQLLKWLLWWPLLILTFPLQWLYLDVIRPFLRRLLPPIWNALTWLAGQVAAFLRRKWADAAPHRIRLRRRLHSRRQIWQARLRVLLRRPQPPPTAVFAPRQPRPVTQIRRLRLATLILSVTIMLIVSFASLQDRQPRTVIADARSLFPAVIEVTSTPAPTTPTPIPTPTLALTPWPTPDPLTEGGSLAFSRHVNGNSDIYILPVGQTEPIRLTSHPEPDKDPAWNPDGREIAFASQRNGNWDIYIYNFPAAQLRRLTDRPAYEGYPSWSPDGQWLVYESYRNNNLDIYIIKADGSEGPYRLTENPALDYAPVWSPGGRHIAYISRRGGGQDIFILSLDQVSDETAVNITQSAAIREEQPVFAPDGRTLAYYEESAGFPLLYAIPLDDNMAPAGAPYNLGQQGQDPAWSPDGEAVVFVHHKENNAFLMAGSPNAWGVAPQAYATDGRLNRPTWSAVTLSPDLAAGLGPIDSRAETPPLYIEAQATPDPDQPNAAPVLLWEQSVNAPSPYLSDRVDQSFQALRRRVIDEAGWDLLGQLDHMFEPLDARPLPGQSARSWNKAGRAFALAYREVTAFEPLMEAVREEIDGRIYWRIYIRTAAQDGSQGQPLRDLPWDFRARYGDEPRYYDQGGKLKDAIPAGYYIDFTTLAADYGWEWVPADENWRTYFPGVRFGHYEKRQGLTWEQAMLEIYTPAELAAGFGQ